MMKTVELQDLTDRRLSNMIIPETSLKLASSASEQNVYFTYVCLINDLSPNNLNKPSHKNVDGDIEESGQEEVPIRVERSKALHELIESHRREEEIEERKQNAVGQSSTNQTATSYDDSELSESEDVINFDTANPNVLKLTKMKWLTEEQEGSPDSSSPSLSPSGSSTSTCSRESEDRLSHTSDGDKYLSTILRLDREHNMFGLSSIAIIGSRPSRKMRREDDRPVFPQTAIVQVCCGKACCRHRSKTDLPSSLKCGGCRTCYIEPYCPTCGGNCDPPCVDPSPCPTFCWTCLRGKCSCRPHSPPPKCIIDCTTCHGMKISVNRKPKYDPSPIELTPRASCVLHKPFAARSCHHLPRCIPPSSCFPYLMPCFWPARPSAPCSVPARCFHNPPCLAPRKRRPPGTNMPEFCPPGKCVDAAKKTTCLNKTCPGKCPQLKEALEARFGQ